MNRGKENRPAFRGGRAACDDGNGVLLSSNAYQHSTPKAPDNQEPAPIEIAVYFPATYNVDELLLSSSDVGARYMGGATLALVGNPETGKALIAGLDWVVMNGRPVTVDGVDYCATPLKGWQRVQL